MKYDNSEVNKREQGKWTDQSLISIIIKRPTRKSRKNNWPITEKFDNWEANKREGEMNWPITEKYLEERFKLIKVQRPMSCQYSRTDQLQANQHTDADYTYFFQEVISLSKVEISLSTVDLLVWWGRGLAQWSTNSLMVEVTGRVSGSECSRPPLIPTTIETDISVYVCVDYCSKMIDWYHVLYFDRFLFWLHGNCSVV